MVAEYVTDNTTSTVHMMLPFKVNTLCGRVVSDGRWDFGDETISGLASTCATCTKILRKANA
jgi:hypothetical protein